MPEKTMFYFFSGKGGVGKTSVAAAASLRFAKHGKKTLIVSIDPAHSLSDSFEQKIGGDVTKINDNLSAVEIDPKKSLDEYKKKIDLKMEGSDMFKDLGLGDMNISGMVPGIDEMAAFDKFVQYMHGTEYDVVVFDTAPTGHTLRFLSLPDVLDSWIGKIITIRLKFSGVINMFKKMLPFGQSDGNDLIGTETLEKMKKRIEEAKKILTDPKRTTYNIVMIPEEMSILESERSMSVLDEYCIPVGSIIVNQLIPHNPGCKFCAERRKTQQDNLLQIKKKFKKYNIAEIPLFPHEIKGRKELARIEALLDF